MGRGGEGRRAWLGFLGSSRFQGRGGPEGRGGQGFVAWVDGWDGWWKRRPLLKKTTTTGRRKEKNKVVWCRIVIDDSRPGERSTSAGLEWLQCGVLRSERSVWRSSGAAAGPGAGAGGGRLAWAQRNWAEGHLENRPLGAGGPARAGTSGLLDPGCSAGGSTKMLPAQLGGLGTAPACTRAAKTGAGSPLAKPTGARPGHAIALKCPPSGWERDGIQHATGTTHRARPGVESPCLRLPLGFGPFGDGRSRAQASADGRATLISRCAVRMLGWLASTTVAARLGGWAGRPSLKI